VQCSSQITATTHIPTLETFKAGCVLIISDYSSVKIVKIGKQKPKLLQKKWPREGPVYLDHGVYKIFIK